MGDAEVNGLIQATRSSDGNDQTETQIASKATSAGRKYQDMLINGDGTNETFPGLQALVAPAKTVGAVADNGSVLSFETMDEVMDRVVDKAGQVDYISMNLRTILSFKILLPGFSGAYNKAIDEL